MRGRHCSSALPVECTRYALYSSEEQYCPANSAERQLRVLAQRPRPPDAVAGHGQPGGAVSACRQGCLLTVVFSAKETAIRVDSGCLA